MTETLWTPRMREVGLRFGIVPEVAARVPPHGMELPERGIVLITGPSGSGKTTLLRALAAGVRERRGAGAIVALERIRLPARAVVDCMRLPLEPALALLGRAGLAEARVWLRMPGELSEGERFRLRLALWMAQLHRSVLVADEFANSLDRITARAIAWQLHKFMHDATAQGQRPLALLATAHEDLAVDLMPAVHVRLGT